MEGLTLDQYGPATAKEHTLRFFKLAAQFLMAHAR
jgi:hypothetical protein